MKSRWILAGLCGLTAMLAGLRDAKAASITITGGYMPGGGDPQYTYIFNAFLNAPSSGTNMFQMGDSFTIDDLPGLQAGVVPPTQIPFQWTLESLTGATVQPSNEYAASPQFEFTGNTPYVAPTMSGGPAFLGTFEITSTNPFANGVVPYPNGTTLSYTYTIDGQTQQGGGTFQLFSVPEPSSLILLAVGAGVLPLIRLRKRSRRTPEEVAC